MSVSGIQGAQVAAVQGFTKATGQVAQAAQQIAEGAVDPAVIVQLSNAKLAAEASAAVVQTTSELAQTAINLIA
ncbi:hypothetical protein [Zavarzinia sp. CC-PAN008]|uniref:hypothetical protein n=1 Tax=Zavarzinia sp. CC-PAN008 TaxID=3243332 RepID=UPI003F7431C7